MDRTRAAVLAVSLMAGCTASMFYSDAEIKANLRSMTAPVVDCPEEQIQVSWPGREYRGGWVAAGCQRVHTCVVRQVGRYSADAHCEETAESREMTSRRVAIDRLSIETGCDQGRIGVLSARST